ncbi:DUF565 domain-containing protein [Geitlerinema sp. PCC 9228]|uniref:DUF565 domain-containing protein n=1 Tax=Geitlerinema sp. PCC 9228 TaxID=111611 RepID=UPI0008F9E16C|nr:DUF565 domain-containing protein [Geitlerinema sp. PCC 9228]
MQDTRLNGLIRLLVRQWLGWLRNPWRRISLAAIAVLFGFFLGTAVSTIAGQNSRQDIVVAAITLFFTETISRVVYTRNRSDRPRFSLELLNALKIGLVYSLFVEALKLGS